MCNIHHNPKKGPYGSTFTRSVFRLAILVFSVFRNCWQIGKYSPPMVSNGAAYLPAFQVTGSWMYRWPWSYKVYLHSIWLLWYLLPSVFVYILLSSHSNNVSSMRNDTKGLMGTVYENYCESQYKNWTTNTKKIKLWQTLKNKLQVPWKLLGKKKNVSFNFHQLLLSNLCFWLTMFVFWWPDPNLRPFFVFKIWKIIFHSAVIVSFLTTNSVRAS